MTRPASLRIAGEVPLDALGPVTVVASPPDMLSQRTVESVCGIGPRQFLETIRTPGFPLRVAKLGALRLVERVAFLAWLADPDRVEQGPADDLDNALLAELGVERTAPDSHTRRRASR